MGEEVGSSVESGGDCGCLHLEVWIFFSVFRYYPFFPKTPILFLGKGMVSAKVRLRAANPADRSVQEPVLATMDRRKLLVMGVYVIAWVVFMC